MRGHSPLSLGRGSLAPYDAGNRWKYTLIPSA